MVAERASAQRLSLQEFLALPETKPASEYLYGQVMVKPMPQFHHSVLQSEICAQINQRARPAKLAYAFPELRCNFGDVSIVPDIVVLRWSNIPFQPDGAIADTVTGVPDWLIEILSPAQSPLQVMNKIGVAMTSGAQVGWLVLPERQAVLTYTGDDIPELKRGDEALPVLDVLADWRITAQAIFELLVL